MSLSTSTNQSKPTVSASFCIACVIGTWLKTIFEISKSEATPAVVKAGAQSAAMSAMMSAMVSDS